MTGPWWFCRVPKLSKGSRLQSPTFSKNVSAYPCLLVDACAFLILPIQAFFGHPATSRDTFHFHPWLTLQLLLEGQSQTLVDLPGYAQIGGNFFEAKLHQLEEVTSDKSLHWDIKFWMTVELYQSQVSLKLVYFSLTALPDSKYNVHLQTSPQKQSSIQTLQKGKTLQRTTKAIRL